MDCDDYDLCTACFPTESHAHHPRHAFAPVVPGSITARHITSKLPPGRNQVHHAICDNCDKVWDPPPGDLTPCSGLLTIPTVHHWCPPQVP